VNAPALSTRRVTDFVWLGQAPWRASAGRAAPRPEDASSLWGQFALHERDDAGGHVLARDRLGVNKLFFALTASGEVDSSNFLFDLLQRGHRLGDVWSVPSGHALALSPSRGEYRLHRHATLDFAESDEQALVAGIRAALATTFERLATLLAGRRLFVTLSGGLDSTTVAMLAREHLGEFTAVTFAMEGGGGESDDLRHARLAARGAGVPLEVVTATPDELAELLDLVLLHGQDWRDFNVHCGLVNAAIGRRLRERLGPDGGSPAPVLLTGDSMNELMADYRPVVYKGVEYYGLPRLAGAQLRRFLVSGLDAGDREVGIFNAFGLDTVQPYALAAEAYAAVPGERLEDPRAKQELVRLVMGARIPEAIYARPKLRAQVGSHDVGGTLAAIADRGIDAAALRRRFADLLGVEERELGALIRGGRYRFSLQAPWEAAQA
jgi:asparagine synthetase B (glutamine-hydrolysing)